MGCVRALGLLITCVAFCVGALVVLGQLGVL